MKCHNCHKDNIRKANYCKMCGTEFTKKEKEEASRQGLTGILITLTDWYEKVTLQKITGHIAFQIASVILVLGIGLYFIFTNGTNLNVLSSDEYNLEYNSKNKEYYVLLDKEDRVNQLETALELYVPNRIDQLKVTYYDDNDNVLSEKDFSPEDQILVSANLSQDNYYVISNPKNKKENIKIFVYYED